MGEWQLCVNLTFSTVNMKNVPGISSNLIHLQTRKWTNEGSDYTCGEEQYHVQAAIKDNLLHAT